MIPIPDPDEDDVYELITNDPALAAVYQYLLSSDDVHLVWGTGVRLVDPTLYIDEDVLRKGDR